MKLFSSVKPSDLVDHDTPFGTGNLKPFLAPMPPIPKHIAIMIELIKDAEKYHNAGDVDIEKKILVILMEHLEIYLSKTK